MVGGEIQAVERDRTVSGHKGIVLISKAEVNGKLVTHPVAISEEPAELPFSGRRFKKLNALARTTKDGRTVSQTKQELGPGVELIGGGSSIRRRHRPAKIEFASRPGTQLRLPVVQVVVNDIGTGGHLMLAMNPPQVMRTGEAPVVPESRVPAFRVADICKAGNRKQREAAVALIWREGTILRVGSGNPQHI